MTSTDLARSTTDLATTDPAELARVVESLVVRGDISALSTADRSRYYMKMCESLGLNPHAQPLAFLKLNGKEVLYATKGATDQLAAMHRLNRRMIDGPRVIDLGGTKLVYAVCEATHPNGRTETAIATVPLIDPVNVLMKCETKAKRRATLSILGLGMLDEMEIETIPASARSEAEQPVLPAETEDRVEDSSRAMVVYANALEDADRPSQVRAAYLALQDGLRAEGKDPDGWTKTARAEALAALRYLGWAPNTAELDQLISVAGHDLAAMLDVPTHIQPGALPLWYTTHKAAVEALPGNHPGIAKVLVARRLAGLTGDPDGAATKRANVAFGKAIAALPVEAPPAAADPDAPFPRGEPGADDGDEDWYATPGAIREYLAGKGTRREVERAVRKHAQRLRSDAARLTFTNAAVARLAEIAATRPGSDGTMPTTETLRRDVAQWADEGPTKG